VLRREVVKGVDELAASRLNLPEGELHAVLVEGEASAHPIIRQAGAGATPLPLQRNTYRSVYTPALQMAPFIISRTTSRYSSRLTNGR